MNVSTRILLLATALALGACNNAEKLAAEKAARHAAQAEKEAATRLASLKQMQTIGRDDLALNFANDILQRFPNTKAAIEAKPLVESLRVKVEGEQEGNRLRELWAYHTTDDKDAGGTVRTAYLYSTNTLGPAEAGKPAPKARLVLRRHPQWGDDVYLLSDRGHFSCPNPCTVSVQFDDAPPTVYPAKLPETGEPAMFVEDFKTFLSALPGAARVRFEVTLKDGGAQTPEFELGGYNPDTIGSPHRPAN